MKMEWNYPTSNNFTHLDLLLFKTLPMCTYVYSNAFSFKKSNPIKLLTGELGHFEQKLLMVLQSMYTSTPNLPNSLVQVQLVNGRNDHHGRLEKEREKETEKERERERRERMGLAKSSQPTYSFTDKVKKIFYASRVTVIRSNIKRGSLPIYQEYRASWWSCLLPPCQSWAEFLPTQKQQRQPCQHHQVSHVAKKGGKINTVVLREVGNAKQTSMSGRGQQKERIWTKVLLETGCLWQTTTVSQKLLVLKICSYPGKTMK